MLPDLVILTIDFTLVYGRLQRYNTQYTGLRNTQFTTGHIHSFIQSFCHSFILVLSALHHLQLFVPCFEYLTESHISVPHDDLDLDPYLNFLCLETSPSNVMSLAGTQAEVSRRLTYLNVSERKAPLPITQLSRLQTRRAPIKSFQPLASDVTAPR